MISRSFPEPTGVLGAIKTHDIQKTRGLHIPDFVRGHFLPEREHLLHHNHAKVGPIQQRILKWLKEHVHESIPRNWYKLVLGHDNHISIMAHLYVRHFHASWRDPFSDDVGWWENVGLVSEGKVTTAFRNDIVDNLITDSTAFGDYKYHEVGTDNTAESNSQTALIVSTGIARVAGTQVEASAPVYRSVASVTADTTETWQEHGIFNASTSGVLMDRSLISPTVAVVSGDTVQFTYEITFNAEA